MAQDPAALVGSVFADKYRLVSVLGAGGFAVVYGAQHLHLPDLRFAIKLLKRVHLDDPLVLARFEREAKTIAGLRSRYTVRVVDSGVYRNEQPYIVMEYVEGQSLRGVLDGYGPLTPLQTAHLMLGVLRAVDEAHSRGIVHRDLKPENIVVDWDKEENTPLPRVLDFGIAKVVDGDAASSTATSTGVTMCTPRYAAPEVLFRSAVPASDIYAIGLIIHELLTGRDPYDVATPYEYARRHVEPAPVPLDPLVEHGPLGAIVRRACMKAPEDRYPSAARMIDDLRAAFDQIKAGTSDPQRELGLLAAWTLGAAVTGVDPFAGSVAFEPTVGIEEAVRSGLGDNATQFDGGAAGQTKAVDGSLPAAPSVRPRPGAPVPRSLGGAAIAGVVLAAVVVGAVVAATGLRGDDVVESADDVAATPSHRRTDAGAARSDERDENAVLVEVDATDTAIDGSAASVALPIAADADGSDAIVTPPVDLDVGAASADPEQATTDVEPPGDAAAEASHSPRSRPSRPRDETASENPTPPEPEPAPADPVPSGDDGDVGRRRPIDPWGNE